MAEPSNLATLSVCTVPADAWVDVLSDVHLDAQHPATWAAFQRYLATTPAQFLLILGDFFEVWVGDDVLDAADGGFERSVMGALRAASGRMQLGFLPGNRDFLLGPQAAAAGGFRLLTDPAVLQLGGERWLLSHGDAACLADVGYQAFRRKVRSTAWQTAFLQQPLPQRQAQARAMRRQSQEYQADPQRMHADADAAWVQRWLQASGCKGLIHGHTHRPSTDALRSDPPGWIPLHDAQPAQGTSCADSRMAARWVLSDWDLDTPQPQQRRAQVLRLRAGHSPQRVPVA